MAPDQVNIVVTVDAKQLAEAIEAARPRSWPVRLWRWAHRGAGQGARQCPSVT